MPTPTMQALHAHRLALLLATLALFAMSFWLMAAEMLHYFGISRTAWYARLQREYGQWFAPSSGLSGMMGVTPFTPTAHAAVAAVGLAGFAASMLVFLWPGRGWMARALEKGPPPRIPTLAAAIVAGLITVGYIATALELLGWWSQLATKGHGSRQLPGVVFEASFTLAMLLWVLAAAAWFLLFRSAPRRLAGKFARYDHFIRLIVVTYCLFIASSLLLLIAGSIQAYHLGFNNVYTASGAYTGAGIGFTVMLWTTIPSLVLIYTGERYRRITEGLCVECGYNLQGATGTTCPECGAAISRIAQEGTAETIARENPS